MVQKAANEPRFPSLMPTRAIADMLSETDIWRAAMAMVKRYGVVAMLEAAARANQLLEDGDPAGAAIWHRILDAIERFAGESAGGGRAGALRAGLETEWYLEAEYAATIFDAERQFHGILILLRYLKQR